MKIWYKWNYQEPITDTEFYFDVDSAGKCTICFRGSELLRDSVKDWLYNLMFWKKLRRYYLVEGSMVVNQDRHWFTVHYGLFRKWEMCQALIQRLIQENPQIKSFEVSGHSQGASTGIFCHMFLKNYTQKAVKTVVSGCPKLFGFIGLRKNRKLCKDVICLEYGNDMVTKIPPGYFKVGILRHEGEDKKWWKWSVKDHIDPFYHTWIELF